MQQHVTDIPLGMSVESTVKQSATVGLIADADLVDEATALAAIETNKAKKHVTERNLAIPARLAIQKAPDVAGDATILEGTDLDDIYGAFSGNPAPGFSIGL